MTGPELAGPFRDLNYLLSILFPTVNLEEGGVRNAGVECFQGNEEWPFFSYAGYIIWVLPATVSVTNHRPPSPPLGEEMPGRPQVHQPFLTV